MPRSYCGGCHHVFSSVKAFDLHRTGSHELRQRRCLSKDEMRAKGMRQNGQGIWTSPDYGQVPFWAKERQEDGAEEAVS
jgi:hypothetical protein